MRKLINPLERFFSKVVVTSDCWIWTGSRNAKGYGAFHIPRVENKRVLTHMVAHRFCYEIYKGFIPEGLTLDHLCKNKACVNPWHLEAVTARENTLRGDLV